MSSLDLRALVHLLERRGQLHRVTAPVSADLEISEVADRLVKRGGPAVLFERVQGHAMPVLINAFATTERMAWALGAGSLDEVGGRVRKVLRTDMPGSFVEKLRALADLKDVATAGPKVTARGACQEQTMREPSLLNLPVLKCWPLDGGPFITLPVVVTRDPETGKRNVGLYRMQVYGEREAGMHWHLHKGGAEQFRRARARMPVAVAIGADPAVTYAATAPLPPGIDEFVFAGFIRGAPVHLARATTVDLEVPADAEIILEGYVDPEERRVEGPFGDHTGYYSLADEYPVFHLTAITHRSRPIYQTTIVGRPPMEDFAMGKATERIFLPLIQMVLPEVADMNMPAEGIFHNLVLVSVRKRFPGHAHKVMYALWGMGQMMFARNIVVVDEDVNVQNVSEVAWRVLANVDAHRDLVVVPGPLDVLDHASPQPAFGHKLGVDATRKTAADGYPREWPPDITMSPEIKALVDERWKEYGFS